MTIQSMHTVRRPSIASFRPAVASVIADVGLEPGPRDDCEMRKMIKRQMGRKQPAETTATSVQSTFGDEAPGEAGGWPALAFADELVK